jgi:hypothetical protein
LLEPAVVAGREKIFAGFTVDNDLDYTAFVDFGIAFDLRKSIVLIVLLEHSALE